MIGGGVLPKGFGFFSGGVNYGPVTTAYYASVLINGGSLTNNELFYLNTFETSLGSDINEFDRLWIFGLSNKIAAKTSFVNPTSLMVTEVNAPIWTSYNGFQSDGASSYIDSNYNPRTQGVKYKVNSAHGFCYTNLTGTLSKIAFGAFDYSFLSATLYPAYASLNQAIYYVNNTGPDTYIVNSPLKMHVVNRQNSTTMQYYQNGIKIDDRANNSTNIANLNINILSLNLFGSPISFYNGRLNAVSFGSANINQINFYNSIQTLGTSLGWAI